MELTNTNTAKWIAVVAAVAVALAFLVAPAPTSADHNEVHTLQQQIEALMAQIAALQGDQPATGSAVPGLPANYQFPRQLDQGMTGQDVMYLQMALNHWGHTVATSGAGSPGNETTYFGSRTGQALVSYQNANSIAPPAPRFGPMTRASVNNRLMAEPPTPPTPPTPPGQCPAGYMMNPAYTTGSVTVPMCIEDDEEPGVTPGPATEGTLTVDFVGIGSEEVNLGQTRTVYEVEMEALDSNININRMDFRFTTRSTTPSGNQNVSPRPWLYFSEVTLMRGNTQIASLSGTSGNFTEITGGPDGPEWRARFTGLNETISMDDTVEYHLRVTALNAMSGDREDHQIDVYMPRDGVRASDGVGIVHFEPGNDLDATRITFGDTAGDLSLVIGDNSPESATFIVDEDNRTNDQTLLMFDATAGSNHSVNVRTVKVNATTTATSTITDIVHRARLYMNGQVVANVSPSNDGFNFTSIDRTISAGATADFEVEVDFRRSVNFDFPLGITVETVDVTFEDQDFVSDTETLTVNETHDIIEEGLVATLVSKSTSTQADGEVGVFDLTFDLTAYGNTFYVSENVATSFPTFGTNWNVTGATNTFEKSITLTSNAALTSNENYRVNEGQTRRFDVRIFVSEVGVSGTYRASILDMVYGDSDIAAGASGSNLEFTIPDFRTPFQFISSSS